VLERVTSGQDGVHPAQGLLGGRRARGLRDLGMHLGVDQSEALGRWLGRCGIDCL